MMLKERPGCRQAAQEAVNKLTRFIGEVVWDFSQQQSLFAPRASARYLTAGKSSDQQEEQASARPTANKTD